MLSPFRFHAAFIISTPRPFCVAALPEPTSARPLNEPTGSASSNTSPDTVIPPCELLGPRRSRPPAIDINTGFILTPRTKTSGPPQRNAHSHTLSRPPGPHTFAASRPLASPGCVPSDLSAAASICPSGSPSVSTISPVPSSVTTPGSHPLVVCRLCATSRPSPSATTSGRSSRSSLAPSGREGQVPIIPCRDLNPVCTLPLTPPPASSWPPFSHKTSRQPPCRSDALCSSLHHTHSPSHNNTPNSPRLTRDAFHSLRIGFIAILGRLPDHASSRPRQLCARVIDDATSPDDHLV